MGEVKTKLTKSEAWLLDVASKDYAPHAEWRPRFDTAHHKWKGALLDLQKRGLLAFTASDPAIRITPAGLALLKGESGNG